MYQNKGLALSVAFFLRLECRRFSQAPRIEYSRQLSSTRGSWLGSSTSTLSQAKVFSFLLIFRQQISFYLLTKDLFAMVKYRYFRSLDGF